MQPSPNSVEPLLCWSDENSSRAEGLVLPLRLPFGLKRAEIHQGLFSGRDRHFWLAKAQPEPAD
jgi:hypothetical protein